MCETYSVERNSFFMIKCPSSVLVRSLWFFDVSLGVLYVMFFLFMAACVCSDLIDEQLDPLPVCSGVNDETITGAINNGEVTYTNLAVNSGRATYQCDEGFSTSDDTTRECGGDGRWSGTLPTCQKGTGIHEINMWKECVYVYV